MSQAVARQLSFGGTVFDKNNNLNLQRMKKFLLLIVVLISTLVLSGQTALPYFSGFDSAPTQAGWNQQRTGSTANPGWYYVGIQAYSTPSCLYHGYPVGGSSLTVDWFISPSFDLSGGGSLDSLRYKFSGFGVPATNDTVALYLLNGSATPSLATKTMLYDFRGANYSNDDTWRKLNSIAITPTPGLSYIAIKYVTIVNWLDVRFDNVRLSGSGATGVPEVGKGNSIRVFSDPETNHLRLVSTGKTEARYMLEVISVSGETAGTMEMNANEPAVFNGPAGLYFYRLYSADKMLVQSGKFIKM
jgi:hypothetical protein